MAIVYVIKDWERNFENNRTRELVFLKWVPMPNKQDGSGYTELLDHPQGPAHFGVWCALVEVASKCKPRGRLVTSDDFPHSCRSLARMTHIPAKMIESALKRLVDPVGWIEAQTVDDPELTTNPAGGCDIGATKPQASAAQVRLGRARENGMEGKGREGKGKLQSARTAAEPADAGSSNGEAAADEFPITWSQKTGWANVTGAVLDSMRPVYPACDIERELLVMDQWLRANPKKAKKSNWLRFVTNWLVRSQDRGGGMKSAIRQGDAPAGDYIDRRLAELKSGGNVDA